MPALRSLSIEHYRGFYNQRDFSFAEPNNQNGSGLTLFVGPNNSGKSSILNAIRLVLSPRQVDLEHRHPDQALRIAIANGDGEERAVSNPDLGANLVASGDNFRPTANDFRIVPSRRSWTPYTGQQTIATQQYWELELGRSSGEIDNYLVSRVASMPLVERSKFDALLQELLPQLNSWKIELSRGQTYIQYETDGGARHAADLFGDGMSSLFRIALALFDSKPNTVVAIDEPELSLHPQAQKTVALVLSRFSKDRQIVVTTHSPYFVNWSDISNGALVYRLTQQRSDIAVGALTRDTFVSLQGLFDDWQKPNLLDVVAREVFFADEVIFFEGQEDVGLLRKFAIDNNLAMLPAFGYGAGGAENIRHFLSMARDLGIPAAAVFDGDKAALKAEVQQRFPKSFIELLPTMDMRDKHKRDDKGRDTEEVLKLGIFDRTGKVKADYVEYLKGLFKRANEALVLQAAGG